LFLQSLRRKLYSGTIQQENGIEVGLVRAHSRIIWKVYIGCHSGISFRIVGTCTTANMKIIDDSSPLTIMKLYSTNTPEMDKKSHI